MPVLSHLHHLFNAEQCQAYIHTLRWPDRPLQCPHCQSHHIGRWGTYQYRPGCNATGVTAASAPSTTPPLPCSTRGSAHCRTGFSRRFCSVSPARHGALPGKWASTSRRAIAGAGGYGMPRCPMRCIANWKGRWKRMTSTTPPATRAKCQGVERRRWAANHVGAARNASPGGVWYLLAWLGAGHTGRGRGWPGAAAPGPGGHQGYGGRTVVVALSGRPRGGCRACWPG